MEDEHRHRREPDDENRAEVANAGESHPQELLADHRQTVASRYQIAGEEDRERDLRKLPRLERQGNTAVFTHRPDADPDLSTVDLAAHTGHERQEQ